MRGRKTGGRRRGTPNRITVDIRAAAQIYGPAAIERLALIAGLAVDARGQPIRGAENEATQLGALRELLDRGYAQRSRSPAMKMARQSRCSPDRRKGSIRRDRTSWESCQREDAAGMLHSSPTARRTTAGASEASQPWKSRIALEASGYALGAVVLMPGLLCCACDATVD